MSDATVMAVVAGVLLLLGASAVGTWRTAFSIDASQAARPGAERGESIQALLWTLCESAPSCKAPEPGGAAISADAAGEAARKGDGTLMPSPPSVPWRGRRCPSSPLASPKTPARSTAAAGSASSTPDQMGVVHEVVYMAEVGQVVDLAATATRFNAQLIETEIVANEGEILGADL